MGSKIQKNSLFLVKYIYDKILFKGELLDFLESDTNNEDNLAAYVSDEMSILLLPCRALLNPQ